MWMSEARVSTARGDDLVHQPDHRRLARQVAQAFRVLFQRFRAVSDRGLGIVCRVRVEAGERRVEFERYGDLQRHRIAGGGLDRGMGEVVQRISDRDAQGVIADRQRQCPDMAQEPRRQAVRQHRLLRVAGRGGDRHIQQRAEAFGQLAFGDQPELSQHGVDPLVRRLGNAPRPLHRPRAAAVLLDQQLQQRFGDLVRRGTLDGSGEQRHRASIMGPLRR